MLSTRKKPITLTQVEQYFIMFSLGTPLQI